jgi:hypothetical protein
MEAYETRMKIFSGCLLKQGMLATFDNGSVLVMVSFHGIATPKGRCSCNFHYPWLGNVVLHGAE